MAAEDRITKVQRWLDLIAYLVARRLPVAVDELMERLPAYAKAWGGGDETARASVRRMFERDKDELRALGIPIETVEYSLSYGMEKAEGYRIRRRDFYLPYLKLLAETGEEEPGGGEGTRSGASGGPGPSGSAGRGRAGGAAVAGADTLEVPRDEAMGALRGLRTLADLPGFPLAGAAGSALRKLTFDLDPQLAVREEAPPGGGGTRSTDTRKGGGSGRSSRILFAVPPEAARARANLDVLSPALLARKRVGFRYHAMGRDQVADRRVHPWGLLFQHSRWYLVGWDLDREAERLFRVDRMEEVDANPRAPNTPDYELPDGPILEKYRDRNAWELGEEEQTVQARARFRFPTSLWAERNRLGTLVEEGEGGAQVRAFQVRESHAFLRWILSLEGEADIESPAELREGLRDMAREVAALYQDHGTKGTEEENGDEAMDGRREGADA